jgi:hypothetical protein
MVGKQKEIVNVKRWAYFNKTTKVMIKPERKCNLNPTAILSIPKMLGRIRREKTCKC